MRELPAYRDHMARLNEVFPDCDMLTLAEVRKFTGYRDNRTLRKHYPFAGDRISKVNFARALAREAAIC